MVHHVEPGQAVTGNEPVVTDAGEPVGMRPPTTADAITSAQTRRGSGKKQTKRTMADLPDIDVESRMRPHQAAIDAAMEALIQPPADTGPTTEYREEPPGMRPATTEQSVTHVTGAPTQAPKAAAPVATKLVATPGGYRDPSLVHLIEPDHVLTLENGNLRKMHVAGHEVVDFGVLRQRQTGIPLMPGNVARDPAKVPALGSGWISYASWTNNTGHPVSRFSTTWVVPPAPSTDHGQTIFLFNGIQNSTMIYQPVLQWGPSAAGGGSYWAVASWYVDGQGGPAFHSNLVRVNSGDVLTGVMHLTGQSGTQFSYGCEFTGIANTSLPINNVQELTWNIETLEAYGIQQCSDYPNTNFTAFTGIDLQTTAGHPAITWSANNAVTDCGQSARIASNANPGGEVDIYYRTRVAVASTTAAINSDGRLEAYEVATNGGVWNIWQTVPHAGPWSPISSLGGIVKAPVCQALNSDGRLEIFGIGTDNAAYNNWQTAAHSGPWSGWNRLGGWVSQLAIARNSDGRLELFGIGGDGAVYNMWQTVPHSGPWSGWNRLGGTVKQICVSLNTDGRLELFAIGTDNALYHIWQTVPHAGPWSGWDRLGGWVSQIASAVNSDGRLEVFGIGADGALYDIWQTAPHSGPWSGWNRLGGWVKQIVPMCNSDGRLEVFGIGSDGALYNIWQTVPHAGPWSAWNRLGGWVSQISAALNSDGRLEVFGIGSDSSLYNIWQTAPHSGPWSGWNRLT
jgi:hypothetical protein